MAAAYAVCAAFLTAALITDVRSMKIPNWLTIPTALSGMLFYGITGGWEGFVFSFQGLAGGFAVLLLMYVIRAVGAGDVKLFGALGAWCGLGFTLYSVFYSVLFAGLIGMGILLLRKEALQRIRKWIRTLAGIFIFKSMAGLDYGAASYLRFPFMVAVVPGVAAAYFTYH